MDSIKNLEQSLVKARADLERAMKAHAVCLVHHNVAGCEVEAEALASAERHVRALEHRLAAAQRETEIETANADFGLMFE